MDKMMAAGPLDGQVLDRTLRPDELAYFERLGDLWWDPAGPFWPLHRLNGFRVAHLRGCLCAAFGRDAQADRPLEGLRLLDVGCGGGILSESMARLGAEVTGIDVVEKNIRVARRHAEQGSLAIQYRLIGVEALADREAPFDLVLNMEVVEHVANLPLFLAACGRLARPGGLMVVATINRTLAAWLMAIVGAEYVLRWLPRGTHHWRRFVKPAEVLALTPGFQVLDRAGVRVNPFTRHFASTRFMGVNYMLTLRKEASAASP